MYTRDIKQWIFSLKEEELILAKQAYEKNFVGMKEATFYQLLARLNEEKVIGKIAKGLYFKPSGDDINILPSSDKLLNFFTNKNRNGMIVGEKMLEKYGVLDNSHDQFNVFTNVIEIKTKRFISNLVIENVDVDYKNEVICKTIEVLELIETIDNYPNANPQAIEKMLCDFAVVYKEDLLFKVLAAKTYKKRNIATLKVILDHYRVANNLSRQLNTASKYSFPKKIEEALQYGDF